MPARNKKYEGLSEEAISCLPTNPGECPYCKTPLLAATHDDRSILRCGFERCIYLRDVKYAYGEEKSSRRVVDLHPGRTD
jgi:ribosomal protein S27AE